MQVLEIRPLKDYTILQTTLSWSELATLPSLDMAMRQVAEVYDFQQHPYLQWMQAETTDRSQFCQSQVPFRFAVESFSQALAAVLARFNQLEERLSLAENVMEEHGRGDRQRSHKYTFCQYLRALGATTDDLELACPTMVLAFNQSLLTYCLSQSGEAGAALLGTIEYLYVSISATIAHTLQTRHWVLPNSQVHYSLHEKLDVEHARELLLLAAPAWTDFRSRSHLSQAMVLGAYYFWSLYRDSLTAI